MLDILLQRTRLHPPFLVLLAAALYFPFLGARDFWGLENMYAEAIRTMFLGGDYLLPRVNEAVWLDSPPLYFWLAALLSWVRGGPNEWTIRLPSAIAATELILIHYYFIAKHRGERAALISTVVLATSVLTVHVERHVPVNMTFYLWMVLALFCSMEVVVFDSRRRMHAYGLWFFMALAFLTNGATGVLIPVMVIVTYLIFSRRWDLVRFLRPFSGIMLLVGLALPWIAYAASQTSTSWLHVIFAQAPHSHSPDHQFFFNFPLALSPWCFLLLPALIVLWPQRSEIWQRHVLFFCVWFAVTLLFFEVFRGRHNHFVFLACIPTALFIGAYLDQLLTLAASEPTRGWTRRFLLCCCGVFFAGGLLTPVVMAIGWPFLKGPALALGSTVVVIASFLFAVSRRFDYGGFIAGFVALSISVNFVLQIMFFPRINPLKVRQLAQNVGSLVEPGGHVAIFHPKPNLHDLNYYSGLRRLEKIDVEDHLVKFMLRTGPKYILVRRDRLDRVRGSLKVEPRIVYNGVYNSEEWVLLQTCDDTCSRGPASVDLKAADPSAASSVSSPGEK